MKHSIRFANTVDELYLSNGLYRGSPFITSSTPRRHSYYDWFLIPNERYAVEPPECKTSYMDIGGANGALDLSEALANYPVYKNREGSMTFRVDNDRLINEGGISQLGKYDLLWNELYRDICVFLHGKNKYMLLEDDPEWYYYGRFSVGRYDASEKTHSEIKISYILQPYKRLCWEIGDDFYWDAMTLPMGTEYAGFEKYQNNRVLTIDSDEYINVINLRNGNEPVIPKFIVKPLTENATPTLDIRFWNDKIGMQAHEVSATPNIETLTGGGFIFKDRQIVFTNLNNPSLLGQDYSLDLKGHANVIIDYDIGVL